MARTRYMTEEQRSAEFERQEEEIHRRDARASRMEAVRQALQAAGIDPHDLVDFIAETAGRD